MELPNTTGSVESLEQKSSNAKAYSSLQPYYGGTQGDSLIAIDNTTPYTSTAATQITSILDSKTNAELERSIFVVGYYTNVTIEAKVTDNFRIVSWRDESPSNVTSVSENLATYSIEGFVEKESVTDPLQQISGLISVNVQGTVELKLSAAYKSKNDTNLNVVENFDSNDATYTYGNVYDHATIMAQNVVDGQTTVFFNGTYDGDTGFKNNDAYSEPVTFKADDLGPQIRIFANQFLQTNNPDVEYVFDYFLHVRTYNDTEIRTVINNENNVNGLYSINYHKNNATYVELSFQPHVSFTTDQSNVTNGQYIAVYKKVFNTKHNPYLLNYDNLGNYVNTTLNTTLGTSIKVAFDNSIQPLLIKEELVSSIENNSVEHKFVEGSKLTITTSYVDADSVAYSARELVFADTNKGVFKNGTDVENIKNDLSTQITLDTNSDAGEYKYNYRRVLKYNFDITPTNDAAEPTNLGVFTGLNVMLNTFRNDGNNVYLALEGENISFVLTPAVLDNIPLYTFKQFSSSVDGISYNKLNNGAGQPPYVIESSGVTATLDDPEWDSLTFVACLNNAFENGTLNANAIRYRAEYDQLVQISIAVNKDESTVFNFVTYDNSGIESEVVEKYIIFNGKLDNSVSPLGNYSVLYTVLAKQGTNLVVSVNTTNNNVFRIPRWVVLENGIVPSNPIEITNGTTNSADFGETEISVNSSEINGFGKSTITFTNITGNASYTYLAEIVKTYAINFPQYITGYTTKDLTEQGGILRDSNNNFDTYDIVGNQVVAPSGQIRYDDGVVVTVIPVAYEGFDFKGLIINEPTNPAGGNIVSGAVTDSQAFTEKLVSELIFKFTVNHEEPTGQPMLIMDEDITSLYAVFREIQYEVTNDYLFVGTSEIKVFEDGEAPETVFTPLKNNDDFMDPLYYENGGEYYLIGYFGEFSIKSVQAPTNIFTAKYFGSQTALFGSLSDITKADLNEDNTIVVEELPEDPDGGDTTTPDEGKEDENPKTQYMLISKNLEGDTFVPKDLDKHFGITESDEFYFNSNLTTRVSIATYLTKVDPYSFKAVVAKPEDSTLEESIELLDFTTFNSDPEPVTIPGSDKYFVESEANVTMTTKYTKFTDTQTVEGENGKTYNYKNLDFKGIYKAVELDGQIRYSQLSSDLLNFDYENGIITYNFVSNMGIAGDYVAIYWERQEVNVKYTVSDVPTLEKLNHKLNVVGDIILSDIIWDNENDILNESRIIGEAEYDNGDTFWVYSYRNYNFSVESQDEEIQRYSPRSIEFNALDYNGEETNPLKVYRQSIMDEGIYNITDVSYNFLETNKTIITIDFGVIRIITIQLDRKYQSDEFLNIEEVVKLNTENSQINGTFTESSIISSPDKLQIVIEDGSTLSIEFYEFFENNNKNFRFNYLIDNHNNKVLTSLPNLDESFSGNYAYELSINENTEGTYYANFVELFKYYFVSVPEDLNIFQLQTILTDEQIDDGLRNVPYDPFGEKSDKLSAQDNLFDYSIIVELKATIPENYIFNGWIINDSTIIGGNPGTYIDIITTTTDSTLTKTINTNYNITAVFATKGAGLTIFGEGNVSVAQQSQTLLEQNFTNSSKEMNYQVEVANITLTATPGSYSSVVTANCYFRYVVNDEYVYFTVEDGNLTVTENADGTVTFTYNNPKMYFVEAYIEFKSTTWASNGKYIAPSGDGTINNPYIISNASHLGWVSYMHSKAANQTVSPSAGKYFKLANDIVLTGNYWLPIGNNESGTWPFAGTFDGNGYKITGMDLYAFENIFYAGNNQIETVKNLGFFGYTENANIYNLTVEGSVNYRSNGTITRDEDNEYPFEDENSPRKATILNYELINLGGIAGLANNTNFVYVQFNNNVAYNEYNWREDHNYSEVSIGGLIGKTIGNVNITDSGFNSTITVGSQFNLIGNLSQVGGLVGYAASGSLNISSSRAANATIAITNGYIKHVGGLVGNSNVTLTVSDSYSDGALNVTTATGIGGIVGTVTTGTPTITNTFYNLENANNNYGVKYSDTMDTSSYNFNYPWENTSSGPRLWLLDNTTELVAEVPAVEGEVYLITTVQQLLWFVQNFDTLTVKTARVGADLDFGGSIWTMVDSVPEDITIDFSGYTVKNVRIKNANAMFNSNYGTIKNLVLTESGNYNSVAVGPQAMVVNNNYGTIEHVQISADIVNKHYNQAINAKTLVVGGVVATIFANDGANIQKSYFNGNINISNGTLENAYIAGLVGRVVNVQNALISQNYASANINVEANSVTNLTIGGLIGEINNSANAKVLDNYAVGNINLGSQLNASNTTFASVIGSITAPASTNVLVQHVYGANKNNNTALNLGAIGNIDANISLTVDKAFVLDSTMNGTINNQHGETKTSEELKDQTVLTTPTSGTFANWDFVNIWKFESGVNEDYPVLQETENHHYINITINFEKGPFGYVYSEENYYAINFFEQYGSPIENMKDITRVKDGEGLFNGITGKIRVPHLTTMAVTSNPNTDSTFMTLYEALLDGVLQEVTSNEFIIQDANKDYTFEFNYRWERYEITVTTNDSTLGNASVSRTKDTINVDGVDVSFADITLPNEYVHGEIVKLSSQAFSTAGLLKWQILNGDYVDIVDYAQKYTEVSNETELQEALNNLSVGEYVYDTKNFELYFYATRETEGEYRAYFVRTYELNFAVDPSEFGDIIEIIAEMNLEGYHGIATITTYVKNPDGTETPVLRYVEGANLTINVASHSNYKIDRVLLGDVEIINSDGVATSETYAEKFAIDYSQSPYYHQKATFTITGVDAVTAGNYTFKLKLIDYKIKVVTSKGGTFEAPGYTFDEENSTFVVTGGEDITFNISPQMRYAFVEFNLVEDELELEERPQPHEPKDYLEVITSSTDYTMRRYDESGSEVYAQVFNYGTTFSYTLSGVNSDMTLYLNYAQYSWYDEGSLDSNVFMDEATGTQIINAVGYHGLNSSDAYIIQTNTELARVMYLINSNKSYTYNGQTYYYKNAYYKISTNTINLETKFWSPIAGFSGTEFGGVIFSGTNDNRVTARQTISNIYMDPYEITLSNGVVISNLDEFANGVGFVGNGNNALISNINLSNVNIDYDLDNHSYVGSVIAKNNGSQVFNANVQSSQINVSGNATLGSIIGLNDNGGTLFKSTANTAITINGDERYVGGLVGENNGLVNASYFNGSILSNGNNFVGGLIGANNGLINMSYSGGSIKALTHANVGGIIGFARIKSQIQNSYVITGNITNMEDQVIQGANEKPIGNMDDTEMYDIPQANMGSESAYVGFNFVNIYVISNNGPQFYYPTFDQTTSELQGSGTKEDPYLILNEYNFVRFITVVNSGDTEYNNPNVYYALGANINLQSHDFNAIVEFNANFNGNGYTISGLHIGTSAESNVALVKVNNGLIRDVKFANAVVFGDNNVAGVVAVNNGVLHGIVFDGMVMGRNNVAGVVAVNGTTSQKGTLVRLGSHGLISGNTNVGGVVGYMQNSNVDNYNDVFTIKHNTDGTVVNTYTGITESYSRATVFGTVNVGGVVGNAENTENHLAIKNVYNTGTVYGYDGVAGIVGKITNANIQFVYSFGDITTYNENVTDTNFANSGVGHIAGVATNTTIGYELNGASLGVAIMPNDNRYIYIPKNDTLLTNPVSIGTASNCLDRTVSYDYIIMQVQQTYTQYGFEFINMWRFYDVENNFNYSLPILKFFHSHLITITVNEFGGYMIDESFGTVNENGEIYVLEGDSLVITFDADTHYHIFDQIVDGVTTKLEPDVTTDNVPSNTPKEFVYTFENVTSGHRIHINFTIDRYKFSLEALNKGTNVGNVEALNQDGTVNNTGIYNYGETVYLKVSGLDHFKLQNINHIRQGAFASTTVIQIDETNISDSTYIHTSTDGVYTITETRELLTTVIDGADYELNYSTKDVVLSFVANDYTANGIDIDAEGCDPATGEYQANFIKQYDLQVNVKTWRDILIPEESLEIGGTVVSETTVGGLPIVNETGYGLIDEGTSVKLSSYPNYGYKFIDYTNGIRPDHEVLSTNSIENFVINSNRTITSNFELNGYQIDIILGQNGQLILYTQNISTGEFVPTTYTIPGTYSIEIKHGYVLKFTAKSNEGYAIASIVASENKPPNTQEVMDTSLIYERPVEYRNVVGPFSVEITFRRELWTDHPSDSLSGSGTKDDPYLITNGHDLGLIANEVNLNGNTYAGKYFKVYPLDEEGNLISGIDLSQYYFNPIGVAGDANKQFKGIISGEFKSFDNIKIDGVSSRLGFFIEPSATITNLTFNNISVLSSTAGAYVGGVAARNLGTLTNIQVNGVVEGAGYTGGVVGVNDGTITKVKSSVQVTGYGTYTGGIAGINNETIQIANNSGVVSGGTNSEYVGGIAGFTNLNSKILEAGNYGSVSGKTAGGIVGNFARGTLTNVYNVAQVNGSSFAGGLFGYKNTELETEANVSFAYNSGRVTGGSTGGIYGYMAEGLDNNFNNVYYLNTYSGNTAQVGADSKTLSELQNINTFANFNFQEIWGIKTYDVAQTNFNNGLPFIWSVATWDNWNDYAVEEVVPDENGIYHITTAEELAWLSKQSNLTAGFADSKQFVIDNNINLYGHYFTPISHNQTNSTDYSYAFNGEFDGNNKLIEGLTIEQNYVENINNMALFGIVGNALVTNVAMENTHIVVTSNSSNAASLAAIVSGTSTIENAQINLAYKTNSGAIIVNDGVNQAWVASTIATVVNNANISKVNSYLNLIVNNEQSGVIVGGIVSTLKQASSVDQVSYSGKIEVENATSVGGIVGELNDTASLTNAFVNGQFSVNNGGTIGGVVGAKQSAGSTLKYTYFNPTLFSANGTNVGGIAGKVSNYTPQAVTDTDTFAYNYFTSNTGLSANQGVGIAGSTNNTNFDSTFYVNRAEMKTPTQLKTESTFVNWDFDFIWAIDYTSGNLNEGYPLFYYNNDYKIIEVTVEHELYDLDGVEYGQVIRRNYNHDGTQSSRSISKNLTTEQVYVLTNNYVGFDVVPHEEGVIETVKVDGIEQVGAARELIEFGQVTDGHTIEVYFIRKLYEFTIHGVIDSVEGITVDSDAKINAILKNTDTGTAYMITLNNGDTKTLYDIARGHYVLIVNPPMFYNCYMQVLDGEKVETNKMEFDLIPTATDTEITVTITKVNDRWLNDSNNNFE